MEDLSEQRMQERCPHCDHSSFAFAHPLLKTKRFSVICDVHPLCTGHILIVPTAHLSCIGEYDDETLQEFQELHRAVSLFLTQTYGAVSSFEHGKFGQTVFHSHVHYLPTAPSPSAIVPEGEAFITPINDIMALRTIFKKQGGYLFFSIGDALMTVDPVLLAPRFFRDRFARALGKPERGNWKIMRTDAVSMTAAQEDIKDLEQHWQKYTGTYSRT